LTMNLKPVSIETAILRSKCDTYLMEMRNRTIATKQSSIIIDNKNKIANATKV
jgi:hypothetical protein